MSLTLDALRLQCALQLVGRPRFVRGVATSGSNNSISDAINLKSEARSGWHKGGWALRYDLDTSDRVRQILEDNFRQGEIITTPDYSATVANGEHFEVWPFGYDPTTVEEALNRGMIRLRIPDEIAVTPVVSQRQYPLAAYPWLTDPRQIKGLYWLSGASGQQTPYPVPGVTVSSDQGALTLNLVGDTFDTSDTLRLVAWRSVYSTGSVTPLVAGADTVNLAADLELMEYVALQTCDILLREPYARRFGPRTDPQRKDALSDIAAQLRRFDERFGGPRSWPLYAAEPSGVNFGPGTW